MKQEYKYTLGGKTYTQAPLKFVQVQQVSEILKDIIINSSLNAVAATMYLINSGQIFRFFAVVLLPEGMTLKQKDIDAIAEDLKWEAGVDEMETGIKVVEDFFACSLEPSRSGRIKAAIAEVAEKIQSMIQSTNPSASSQEATSLSGTPSSTDTAQPTPDPISDTSIEKSSSGSTSSPSAEASESERAKN